MKLDNKESVLFVVSWGFLVFGVVLFIIGIFDISTQKGTWLSISEMIFGPFFVILSALIAEWTIRGKHDILQ